jgi:hypothetical protein
LEQNTSFLKQNKTPLRPEHRKWIPNLKNPSFDRSSCRRGIASCLIFKQWFLEIGQWRHKVTVGTIEANNWPGRSPALRHEKPKQRGVVWDGRLGGAHGVTRPPHSKIVAADVNPLIIQAGEDGAN